MFAALCRARGYPVCGASFVSPEMEDEKEEEDWENSDCWELGRFLMITIGLLGIPVNNCVESGADLTTNREVDCTAVAKAESLRRERK